jgi:acyl transferase domain-containing protein
VPFPVHDLRDRPETEREAEATRLLRDEARRPFDLARGPLVRAAIVRLGDDEHVLLLTLHNIVCDGWSVRVVLRDLGTLYGALSRGLASPLGSLAAQYAAFAAPERPAEGDDARTAAVAYWTAQLAGPPAALALPTDRPRPAVRSFQAATQPFAVPAALADALAALGRSEGATPFMVLLAAFQTLLHRWTGQDDVPVASPVANRTRPETRDLVGLVANDLVLRTDLSGNPTFRELVRRVRGVALAAFAHQDLPFEHVITSFGAERALELSRLFRVMVVLQNAPLPSVQLPGLTLTFPTTDRSASGFDLFLFLREEDGGFRGKLDYSADLFDAGTAARLVAQLGTLLAAAVADPDRPVAALPMADPADPAGAAERDAWARAATAHPEVPAGAVAARVLDERGEPVPALVVGALHAEFAANGTHGAALVPTDRLARWRPDGSLEVLGAADDALRVRGCPVWPRAVEATLARHPAVRDVAVVAERDARGEPALAAYVVTAPSEPVEDGALRALVGDALPVRTRFVRVGGLPRTADGALDRDALAALAVPPAPPAPPALPTGETERLVLDRWRRLVGSPDVGPDENFFDAGANSFLLVKLHTELETALGRTFPLAEVLRHPTPRALGRWLADGDEAPIASAGVRHAAADEPIAVVGMAARFPGARNVEELWRNLEEGVESIAFFAPEELEPGALTGTMMQDPALRAQWVAAAPLLDDVDRFDAHFFGLNPREAELMDPQHRLFLECAWEALEHAGWDAERFAGRIGVYGGSGSSTYFLSHVLPSARGREAEVLSLALASDKDFLATRVSYKLGLTGPSVNVQSACSTSLVAVHLACRSLLAGECDMALAGGVSIRVPQKQGHLHRPGGILSADGHCRAFDASADGTIFGSGVGTVVLKRLSDALAAGDTVHAIVRGSAINNDGAARAGYTAPGEDGQARVVADALAAAGVSPDTLGYVETHGTATALGDMIEVRALTRAFRTGTARRGYCALGSVKTNFGHLDAAAGIAGLIKTVLALARKKLPPSLHFETPNPRLELETSPFYVNARLAEWPGGDGPRRAGVSSFGMGGTNAHVVLEEAPPAPPAPPARATRTPELLVLSAKTESALDAATDRLAAHLRTHPELDLADVAATSQLGRRVFGRRRALVCTDVADALAALGTRDRRRLLDGHRPEDAPRVAFMFPGQGAQRPNMGRGLYETEPVFRAHLDASAEILRPHLGLDLRAVLYPPPGAEAEAAARLDQTWLTQPALFAVEHALAELWMSWGVAPDVMIGHSVGEYVAACLAGVFRLEDALALVAARGRMIQQLPAGAMLAVRLDEEAVRPDLDADLALASVNGPGMCVVSGPEDALARLEARLAGRRVASRRLHASHAFHSAMMEPIVGAFTEVVAGAAPAAPRRAWISNLTGAPVTAEEATDPAYWARHLRHTVRFGDGIRALLGLPGAGDADRAPVLLEVGPGQTLAALAGLHDASSRSPAIVSSLSRAPERREMLAALGRLWVAGVTVDWAAVRGGDRSRRIPLPTYPFERQRYWIDAVAAPVRQEPPPATAKDVVESWFWAPSWRRAPLVPAPAHANGNGNGNGDGHADVRSWLVFLDDGGLGAALAERLRVRGDTVVSVRAGARFERGPDGWVIDPGRVEDHTLLLREVRETCGAPNAVVHLWGVGTAAAIPAVELGFFSVLFLAQALGRECVGAHTDIVVACTGTQDVTGDEALDPVKCTVLGPCKVIPQEYPNLTCRTVDLGDGPDDRRVAQLLAELTTPSDDRLVAWRGPHRWVQTFERVPAGDRAAGRGRLRARGVYLVTGGLGDVGLVLAGGLARAVEARLVLVGRTPLPPRDDWDAWLRTHDPDDAVSRKLEAVRGLEAAGAEVLAVSADVADEAAMRDVVRRTLARFGAIHGVVHSAGLVTLAEREVQDTDRAFAEMHFDAKVAGTLVLDRVLDGMELDFRILMSSLSAVLGGLGLLAYAAGNAFLDAFAHAGGRRGDADGGWTSVDWDAWVTGRGEAGELARAAALGIGADEGREAFERLLAMAHLRQVLVSATDLAPRLERWVTRPRGADADGARARYPRPALATRYVAPQTELEKAVAEIWQDVLGIDQIGLDDDFFELGGSSLLATQLAARVRAAFAVEVSLVLFRHHPTVASVAAYVASPQAGGDRIDASVNDSHHRGSARRSAISRRARRTVEDRRPQA